jgi:hypothetical protein
VCAIVSGAGITCLNLVHLNAHMLLLGPSLCAAGFLALRSRSPSEPLELTSDISNRVSRATWLTFWLLFASASLLAHGAPVERPPLFFVLLATAATALALTAQREQSSTRLAAFLCGAAALSLLLRGSVFSITPGLPGSDAWAHAELIEAIADHGHIPERWDSPYYLHYPVYHVAVAFAVLCGGVPVKAALYAAVGIPLVCSALCLFVVVERLSGRFAACLSMLLILVSSYHLQWGTQLIPTSMGLALFTVALMLTMEDDRHRSSARVSLLLISCTTLVLCHTVSSFILWATLVALLAGTAMARGPHPADPTRLSTRSIAVPLLFLTVAMFTYWGLSPYTTAGETFLNRILVTLRDSVTTDAAFLDRPAHGGGPLADELLAIAGFALYYFLVAVGSLSALRARERTSTLRIVAFATGALTAFVFVFPLFGIRNILPHRWFAFIWVLGAPLAAEGFSTLTGRWRHAATRLVAAAAGLWLFSFLMTTAPVSNTDSPLYAARLTQRLTFHQSELCAAEWLALLCGGPYASDLQFGERVLGDYHGLEGVSSDLAPDSAPTSRFYLWRATTMRQPVQVSSGRDVVLTPMHARTVEATQPAVYASRSAIVAAPMPVSTEEEARRGA